MTKTSEYKMPMREIFDGMAKKSNENGDALSALTKLVSHFAGPNRSDDTVWHTAAQYLYKEAGGDMYPPHSISTAFSRMFTRDGKLVGIEFDGIDANKSTGTGKAKMYLPTVEIAGGKAKRDNNTMIFYDSTNIATLDGWVKQVVIDKSVAELRHLPDALSPAYEMANAKSRLRTMLNGSHP